VGDLIEREGAELAQTTPNRAKPFEVVDLEEGVATQEVEVDKPEQV